MYEYIGVHVRNLQDALPEYGAAGTDSARCCAPLQVSSTLGLAQFHSFSLSLTHIHIHIRMCTVQHSLVHRFGRGCRRQRASALPSARAAHDGRAHPRELLGRGRRLARVGLASGTRYSALMSLGLRLRSRLRERRAHRRRLCAQMNKLSYIRGDAALLLKEYLLWHWFGLVRRPAPPFPTCRPALFTLPRLALYRCASPPYFRTRGPRSAVS